MERRKTGATWCALGVACLASAAWAVNIEMVTVGNPGNMPDTRYASPGYGAVAYTYQIGKFEVTAGQYVEFLNAVAKTDTYGLWRPQMAQQVYPDPGSNIQRTGSLGNYTYSVAPDWANRPVDWVSWVSAARFCNWLTNAQPTGEQGPTTTEDGSYFINGLTSEPELHNVTRRPDARYVIPTEDEWYKAAYYDPHKPGGPSYWDYPTRSDAAPSNALDLTGTNNANYDSGSGYTIGTPYYRTEVGTFANSPSPYGTFDQGGNVTEWNESLYDTPSRGSRGGSWGTPWAVLHASYENWGYPYGLGASYTSGFRVAHVPEPGTIVLLAFAFVTSVSTRSKVSWRSPTRRMVSRRKKKG